jgi:hypothetical protein
MSGDIRQHGCEIDRPTCHLTFGEWLRSRGQLGRIHAAYRFLYELRDYRRKRFQLCAQDAAPGAWLIPFRNDLRELLQFEVAPKIFRDQLFHEPELRGLYVSLLSKVADRCRLMSIDEYTTDPSLSVRRHVAKALRRLEAWRLLDEMAKHNPDDARIQWFAFAPTRKRAFPERLRNFTANVNRSHAAEAIGPSRMAYWSRYTPWQGRPPKSLSLIREILWRIRRWVHGS